MLVPVLSLGVQSISDFVSKNSLTPSAPLELILCDPSRNGCGLLQLKHTVDQQYMYRNYWYRSGVNQTMRVALADITKSVAELIPLTKNSIVVDTGSNDNTLLNSYQVRDLNKVGFEPAINLMPYAKNTSATIINDFFTANLFKDKVGKKVKAQAVTSIAMFYDLEQPNEFVADIREILAPDGLWIIQMAYLPVMLADNIFDNICHEHLEYYSLSSLEFLLKRHDLKVIDVELNNVNGGSYRTFITHKGSKLPPRSGASERLAQLRFKENAMHLATTIPYQLFRDRVAQIKRQVVDFIVQEKSTGKTIYVYGASTKGNTLLQYFNLNHKVITAAAERNPAKWGKRTVSTNIPIISEKKARDDNPDYFLILPWHFLAEFKNRESQYLENGGKFIVPLPKFRVIGAE